MIGKNAFFSDGRRGGRPPRRNDEEKAHDPLIEERLQRERPCRTLFIRNIKVSLRKRHSGRLSPSTPASLTPNPSTNPV